jgi:hypothetical protein
MRFPNRGAAADESANFSIASYQHLTVTYSTL